MVCEAIQLGLHACDSLEPNGQLEDHGFEWHWEVSEFFLSIWLEHNFIYIHLIQVTISFVMYLMIKHYYRSDLINMVLTDTAYVSICIHYFVYECWRDHCTLTEINQGPKGGSLEPWSPEIFVMEPGAQSLSWLGARTKMLCLAKWSLGVKQWSPGAPNFLSWSPAFFRPEPWSPKPLWHPDN